MYVWGKSLLALSVSFPFPCPASSLCNGRNTTLRTHTNVYMYLFAMRHYLRPPCIQLCAHMHRIYFWVHSDPYLPYNAWSSPYKLASNACRLGSKRASNIACYGSKLGSEVESNVGKNGCNLASNGRKSLHILLPMVQIRFQFRFQWARIACHIAAGASNIACYMPGPAWHIARDNGKMPRILLPMDGSCLLFRWQFRQVGSQITWDIWCLAHNHTSITGPRQQANASGSTSYIVHHIATNWTPWS